MNLVLLYPLSRRPCPQTTPHPRPPPAGRCRFRLAVANDHRDPRDRSEPAVDQAVEQHRPVGLRLERDLQTFVFEVTLVVGDGQRRHVGQLDEAGLEVVLLGFAHGCPYGGVQPAG